MWFLDQLEPGSAFYNVPLALRLEGDLHIEAMQQALSVLAERHESLRTTFPPQEGTPVQDIAPPAPFLLPLTDFSGLPPEEREYKARLFIEEEAATPFDLADGPLWRAKLLRLGEHDHILMTTMHHIICDGWSMGVIQREVSALYAAFAEGRPSPLPPLPIQYADYAVWQRRYLAGEALQRQAAYWKKALAGAPAFLTLPADRPRPAQQDYTGASVDVRLSARLTRALKQLSLRHGATLHMTLLAGWAALLSRLSGQDEVVMGTPVANRSQIELEELVGFFVNTLALRVDLSGAPTVAELLGRTKAVSIGAQEQQDLPFEQVVEIVQPPRSMSHSAVFQAMFAWQNAPESGMSLPGLKLSVFESGHEAAKFDVTLFLDEAGDGIAGAIVYASSLFERETVERWGGYFVRLLEGMAADETQQVERIALLSDAERQRVLVDWNDTAAEYPADQCIHELFEAQASRTPDAVAVVYEDRHLTYAELNARANRLARHLRGLGVKPDDRVAICVERGLEMVVGLLAILKAGGAYVPLDPAYPAERLAYMLEDSASAALLTGGAARAALDGCGCLDMPVVDLEGDAALWAAQPESNPERAGLTPQHLAYVLYTSGSTGRPKGVSVEHRQVVNYIWAVAAAVQLDDVFKYMMVQPLTVDFSVTVLYASLLLGGQLHVIGYEAILDARYLAAYTRRHAIDCLKIAPPHLQTLLDVPESAGLLPRKVLIIGGDVSRREWMDKLRSLVHGCLIFNHYGPTETTVGVTVHRVDEAGRCGASGSIPIGRPIRNTQAYILDRHGSLTPIGVVGDLYIGGAQVTRGYLNRPELTAASFIPDPFSKGGRLYRTGDRARFLADGAIEFLGRADDQVKVAGHRIELEEISAALLEHPAVRQSATALHGETEHKKALVAYAVLHDGMHADPAELRQYLAGRLPAHMVPAAVVRLEALPLMPHGKLDRKALPVPKGDAYAAHGYEPPQGEAEETMACIWAGLLGVERVGRHDNFFELGGHSLLAVQLISRVRQAFGADVPLTQLFAKPVLLDFAGGLDQAPQSALPAIAAIERRSEPLPLSFAQQRLWFLSQFGEAGAAYHIPNGVRLQGRLDRLALQRALDAIVARHEALRTTFAVADGEPRQQIADACVGFALTDWDVSAEADAEGALRKLAQEEATAPFDLERGPLIRSRLVRLCDEDHALLVTMHHIVSDGWSMGVLISELGRLYAAFTEGLEDFLPPLPIQYADYAVWQRRYLAGEALQRQAAYWKKALAGAPAFLTLPADRPRPAQQDYTGASVDVRLSARLTRALKQLSLRHGATLHMTLLAGWAALLSRLSGQDEVVMGTPVANRSQIELEELVGFFVNTLALRVDLSGAPTVAELLGRTKAVSIGAQEHQDLPFEQVVEIVRPPRSMSHSAVFQAMFAWQNAPESGMSLPGLKLSVFESGHEAANFDVTLFLGEAGDGIAGAIVYASSLFERETVERWGGYFVRLLEGMAADETQQVERIALLSDAERQRVLVDWNDTAADYPVDQCIHELFEAQASRTPDAVAVVYEDRHLTYAELNARANRLARHLRGLGVKPDDRVAICVERGLEMVVGLLAILKAGGAYVPLDPAYPAERLAYMLEDSASAALLTGGAARAALDGCGCLDMPVVDLEGDAALWAAQPESNPERAGLTPDHLAYVIYTSGSTGRPKGVMVEHRGLCNYVSWAADAYTPTEGSVVSSPLAFDATVTSLYTPLLCGSSLSLLSERGEIWGINQIVSSDERCGLVKITPAHLELLGKQILEGKRRVSASQFIIGGEELWPSTVQLWHNLQHDIRLINEYGPTETVVGCTVYNVPCPFTLPHTVPIGRPIANTQIYILDAYGEPSPIGVAGEIHVGGAGVARGYLNRPELTTERFVADAFAGKADARMYKTGDLGRWLADGTIEFLGRNDFQVRFGASALSWGRSRRVFWSIRASARR